MSCDGLVIMLRRLVHLEMQCGACLNYLGGEGG